MTTARGYGAIEDPALVALVVEGDGAALEALYDRYAPVSYALAHRMLADERAAQDVVREVFLTVWADARTADSTRGGLPTWLLSLTHFKAVDALRREHRLRRRRTADDALGFDDAGRARGPDESWTGMRRGRARAAMDVLPPAQREALVLAYFGGYTQREVAKLTDAPLGTVKSRMLAGLRRLQDALDEAVDAPDAPWRSR